MNIFNVKLLGLSLIFSAILLNASASAYAGDPVPGIDVSLEQIPGGIVTHMITGLNGKFAFTGLAAGNYKLSLMPSTKAKNYNSSRSNVSHRIMPGGGTEYTVVYELSHELSHTVQQTGSKSNNATSIVIGGSGGAIVGTVSTKSARQNSSVK